MNSLKIILIFLFLISCNKQEKNFLEKKKINIQNFKKNWKGGGAFFLMADGTKIEQYENDDGYNEIINKSAPEFISEYNTYYKNGNLKSSVINFKGIPIHTSIEYNSTGDLISEKNEDKKFGKIKYTDILKILSEEKYLNLITGKGWSLENGNDAINIRFDELKKIWKVSITSGKSGAGGKTGSALIYDHIFYIDGETGKIVGE
ncbi:hypothetical protein IV494_14600 [Kaistella sp. G5-32]|uniref:Uncharacterized protein n=1 Tax=Kaistella gelatinilytica TaxID=2787636 RepID=A0ABS0FFA9_9FLAO|nr:hypothetical protein [Kaistella gelatinilytica]MBF8458411.1 hypothetical protein [Kaistella gelatinilytica]